MFPTFPKTKVLDVLSVASVVAILITLYSIVELAKTGIFPPIGFLAMVFVGAVLLLHAVYFYGIRNKPTRDTKLKKKILSAVNILSIFALVASFLLTVAADMFLAILWVLVIVMLNLAFTIERLEKS